MRINKPCSEADWSDPELRRIMIEELHYEPERIDKKRQRKQWEWAMGWHALDRHGCLDRDRRALGVGCGHERFMYALTTRLGQVIGTDLYGETTFDIEAKADVLKDPSKFYEFPYEPERLEVRNMDARRIDYPDQSFDVVFSFSSLEHFGPDREIVRAMREARRVLKPGGVYVLCVDYIGKGPWPEIPRDLRRGVVSEFMTRRDVERLLLDAPGFTTREPIDFELDLAPNANIYDIERGTSTRGAYHPHIILRSRRFPWRPYYITSLSLALFKGA